MMVTRSFFFVPVLASGSENYIIFFFGGFPFDTNIEPELFWISLVSRSEGVFKRQRKRALELIAREYHHHPLSRLAEGLFRHQPGNTCILYPHTHDPEGYGIIFYIG